MQLGAGVVLYRRTGGGIELLLLHHGGPYWAGKDDHAWTIPKGLCESGEEPLAAARREFAEETGTEPPDGLSHLGRFRLSSAKTIDVWMGEGDFDVAALASNSFALEWPPRSGRMEEFPEADRAGWFAPGEALQRIAKGQAPIVGALLERLGEKPI